MKFLKILYLCYAVVLFLSLYEWLFPRLAVLKGRYRPRDFGAGERGKGTGEELPRSVRPFQAIFSG